MGRQRKDAGRDAWCPKRVYRGRSAWEWKTPGGKTVRLCRLDQPPHVVLERYAEAVDAHPADETFAHIAKLYHESAQFKRLSTVTQTDYEQASQKPLGVFGHLRPSTIKPPMIRKYMDRRGVTSTYRANRELSWLMVVFGFGFERGMVPSNPVIGVKKFAEQRHRHYVTPEAYQLALNAATPPIRVAMELAYCTGLRQADVLSLTWQQVKPEGILVRQSKTGREVLKEITPRVQAALDLAKALPRPDGIECWYVVHTRAGRRYTRTGFNSSWQRLKAGFTFHDLRRAGATDMTDAERQSFTGHASQRMAESYNVKPIKSRSH